MEGDIMKEFRRIISMLMILVLFIGILPMNLGVVKAEAELDETTKLKNIKVRAYNSETEKWDDIGLTIKDYVKNNYGGYDAIYTPIAFDSGRRLYQIKLDPKYKKIQFYIEKANEEQALEIGTGEGYKIRNSNYTEETALEAGSKTFKFFVLPSNGSAKREYVFTVERGDKTKDAAKIHRLNVTNGSVEFHEAYEGDIVTISADGSYKKVFDRWVKVEGNNIIEIEQGNDIIKEPNKTPTELRMPNHNLRVKPIFKESLVSDSSLRNIILYGLEDEVWKNQKSKLVFNKEQKTYSVDLSNDYSEAYVYLQFGESKQTISATLNDKAIVLVEESNVFKNGDKTEKLELNDGKNIFKIIVKSEDKQNTSIYTLIVNRGEVKYKVSFNPGDGSGSMDAEEFIKGSKYNLPECKFEAPANKEFKSWRVNGEEKAVGDVITINEDTEITAIWQDKSIEKYKVTLVANNNIDDNIETEIEKGTNYTLPDCSFTAPGGQVFKAWEVAGEEKAVGDVITINEDTEITATWRDKPIETIKVTLVANNGTNETKGESVEKGKEYTLPDCPFTAPDGQVFKAWKIAEIEYNPQESIKIDEATIIKAIWQDKLDPDKPNQKHAINITPSPYGEVIIDPLEAKAGDKVTVRAIANYGYELVGLSVRDASGKLLPIINGEFIMPDGEVSISSIFREIAPYIEPEIDDKAEREEQKRRHRRNYYHEEEKDEDEVKTIDKVQEEKQKGSKVLITIGSEMLDKVDNGVRTLKAMDAKPYIKSGRTMLPLRYVAEALGYRAFWLSETRTAVIMDIGLRVEIPVDSNFIIINGVKYTSDVKPEMRKNRIMLPIANIARALGLKDGKDILWDEVNRQVTLIRNFNTK